MSIIEQLRGVPAIFADWGRYVPEYFKEKHGYGGDAAKLSLVVSAAVEVIREQDKAILAMANGDSHMRLTHNGDQQAMPYTQDQLMHHIESEARQREDCGDGFYVDVETVRRIISVMYNG